MKGKWKAYLSLLTVSTCTIVVFFALFYLISLENGQKKRTMVGGIGKWHKGETGAANSSCFRFQDLVLEGEAFECLCFQKCCFVRFWPRRLDCSASTGDWAWNVSCVIMDGDGIRRQAILEKIDQVDRLRDPMQILEREQTLVPVTK